MNIISEKKAFFAVLMVTGLALTLFSINERVQSEEIGYLKGELTIQECLQSPDCYLEEWDKKPSSLILFSTKRNIFKIEKGAAPNWKFMDTFGKQVIIKGTKKGNTVTVNDIVPVKGSGKISKSCL